MIPSSISDLSRSYQLRSDTTRIRTDLTKLTRELSSGVTDDIVGRVKGNFGPLASVERGLARMESFKTVIAEQSLVVTSYQAALTNMRSLGETIRGALLTVPITGDPTLVRNAGADALARFSSVLNGLNSNVGGISIFAGTDTNRPAIADAETIMSSIEGEIALAGATTAADIETVVTTWFAAGGGFDTTGYLGGAAMTVGTQVSDGETLAAPMTAEAQEIRDMLASMALAGLLGRNALAGDPVEQGALARAAGERLIDADGGIVDLQSRLGATEEQLQRASVEVATESDSLAIARSELIEIDPYDVAVRLQNAETQLQTLYSITARLSRLSLAQYL